MRTVDEICVQLERQCRVSCHCQHKLCFHMKNAFPWTSARREVLAASPELGQCMHLLEKAAIENLGPNLQINFPWRVSSFQFFGPELLFWLRVKFALMCTRFEDWPIEAPFDMIPFRLYSNATRVGNATEAGVELMLGARMCSRYDPTALRGTSADWQSRSTTLASSFSTPSSDENTELQDIIRQHGLVCDGAQYFSQFCFEVLDCPAMEMVLATMRIPFKNLPVMRRFYSAWLSHENRGADRISDLAVILTVPFERARMECGHHSEQGENSCDNCATLRRRIDRAIRQTQEAQTLLEKALPNSEVEATKCLEVVEQLREKFRLFATSE